MATFDPSVPSAARIYDYLLGGKDNYASDREAAEAILRIEPESAAVARQNRAFLGRAVRYLVREKGIRQYLDIGSGLPTGGNVHEVAQAAAPESRAVYVDNDQIVLAHARALLDSAPQGRCGYVQSDFRDTRNIITQAAETLDFTKPVAVLLIALLHFIPDADDPWADHWPPHGRRALRQLPRGNPRDTRELHRPRQQRTARQGLRRNTVRRGHSTAESRDRALLQRTGNDQPRAGQHHRVAGRAGRPGSADASSTAAPHGKPPDPDGKEPPPRAPHRRPAPTPNCATATPSARSANSPGSRYGATSGTSPCRSPNAWTSPGRPSPSTCTPATPGPHGTS